MHFAFNGPHSRMNTCSMKLAVKSLHKGGVIAYPTESVWGIGCDPFNQEAVYRILELKRRRPGKGLILVASSMAQIFPLLQSLSESQMEILGKTWPGPNTWLIPDVDQLIPGWIKGKFETVAIRVSAHPVVKKLCEDFGGLIVSTSANPEGRAAAKTRLKVVRYFPRQLDCIVAGSLGSQRSPSVIRDLVTNRTIRGVFSDARG